MAKSRSNGLLWSAGSMALAVAALGAWLTLGGSTGDEEATTPFVQVDAGVVDPTASARRALEAADASAHRLRITEEGRITLDIDDLPAGGPVLVALDLSDDVRGTGERVVRIVSERGERLDATARAIAGTESGVELSIDRAFLAAGRYMLEIETEGSHPLKVRRYVLELE